MKDESIIGEVELLGNQMAFALLRSPTYTGRIIIPDSTSDTRFMSQTVMCLGKGKGYRKKRVTINNWAEGSKRWRTLVKDVDQVSHSKFFTKNVKVGEWHFLKHPFVRDQGVWVKNLNNTHPGCDEYFDPEDTKFEDGSWHFRVFLTCSSEVLGTIDLEGNTDKSSLYRIKRGEMLSTA